MKPELDPLEVHPSNIWTYRQNKPTLVVRDLARYGVPAPVVYAVLMARGVFKWLAVRRDLIKLKKLWRSEITTAHARLLTAKRDRDRDAIHRLRGEIAVMVRYRQQVRALCHSARWRAPDFDGGAWNWMQEIAPGVVSDVSPQLRRELRLANRSGEPVTADAVDPVGAQVTGGPRA